MVATRLIISEGAGDASFFTQLIKVRKLTNFKVHQRDKKMASGSGAFEAMLRAIKFESYYSDIQLVILVGDNDSDPSKSFLEIVRQIKSVDGYAVPTQPRKVAKGPSVKAVSVLMLPWDNVPGGLDTLCYALAANRRPAIASCVKKYIECVNAKDWEPSPLGKMSLRCLLSAACPTDPNIGITHAWSSTKKPTDLIPLERNESYLTNIVKYLRKLP